MNYYRMVRFHRHGGYYIYLRSLKNSHDVSLNSCYKKPSNFLTLFVMCPYASENEPALSYTDTRVTSPNCGHSVAKQTKNDNGTETDYVISTTVRVCRWQCLLAHPLKTHTIDRWSIRLIGRTKRAYYVSVCPVTRPNWKGQKTSLCFTEFPRLQSFALLARDPWSFHKLLRTSSPHVVGTDIFVGPVKTDVYDSIARIQHKYNISTFQVLGGLLDVAL